MATQSATNILFVIKHDELFNRMHVGKTISECMSKLNRGLTFYLESDMRATVAWSCHAKHCRIMFRKFWPTA